MTNKIAWEKWDDIDLPQLEPIDEKEDMFFPDGEIDEEGNGYQQMDYGKVTPLLTAALKEAIAKIETLEAEVAALKSS